MKKVVITGTGIISPLGNDVETFWTNIINGKCGIGSLQGFDDYDLPMRIAGQVQDFDCKDFGITASEARRSDKFCWYAYGAAEQAIKESRLQSGVNISPERFGVYVGSCIGGLNTFIAQTGVLSTEGAKRISPHFITMMIINMAGGNLAIKYNAQGPCLSVVSACATGTNAIGEAYLAIAYGRADAIIAGGSDAAVHPLTIGAFANCKALSTASDPSRASTPFDRDRSGFVMSEGAGIMIMEEYEHALARGAEIIAEVAGYGTTCDAYHCTAPSPEGLPASKAMKEALKEAGYDGSDSLYINAHGTGTILNDKTETNAIKLALGDSLSHKIIISSPKSMTGDRKSVV